MSQPPTPGGFNWGTGIFITLGLFVLLMAGFVYRAVIEDQPLSAADPYAQSKAYESKQKEIANAQTHPITARQVNGELHLTGEAGVAGTLVFFRPDGTQKSLKANFKLDSTGLYRLHMVGLPPGRWVLRMSYRAGVDSCYSETPLTQPAYQRQP